MSTRNNNGPWWFGYKRKVKPTLLTLPSELREMIWAHVTRSSHPAGAQLVRYRVKGYRKFMKAANHTWRYHQASQNLQLSRYDLRRKNQRVAALARKFNEGVHGGIFKREMLPGDMSYVMGPLLVNHQMHNEILASIVRENRITLTLKRRDPKRLKDPLQCVYDLTSTQEYILRHGRNLRILCRDPYDASTLARELSLRPEQNIRSLELCFMGWSQEEIDRMEGLSPLYPNCWKNSRLSLLTLKKIPAEKVMFTCQEIPDEVRSLYWGRVLHRGWLVGTVYATLASKLVERTAPVAEAMMQLARNPPPSSLQPNISIGNGKRAREENEDEEIEGSLVNKRPREHNDAEDGISAISKNSGLFGNSTQDIDVPASISSTHPTTDHLAAPLPSISSHTFSDHDQHHGCNPTQNFEPGGGEDVNTSPPRMQSVLDQGRKRSRDQDDAAESPQSKRPKLNEAERGRKRSREMEDEIESSPAKRYRSESDDVAGKQDDGNSESQPQVEHADFSSASHGKKRARDEELEETTSDSRSAKQARLQESESESERGTRRPQSATVDDSFASLFEEPEVGPEDDAFASLFEDPDEPVPQPHVDNEPRPSPDSVETALLKTPLEQLHSSSHENEPEPPLQPTHDHATSLPLQPVPLPPQVRHLSNTSQLVADDPWFRGLTRNT